VRTRRQWWLVASVVVAACGPMTSDDDGGLDAGGGGGGFVDAGADGGVDAGAPDAGAPVDGGVDAGAVDAGVVDAGVVDAGAVDAGLDAGMDAGVDAGIDAGVDAGPVVTWTFPPCLGPSLPLQRSGQLEYVTATLGAGVSAQAKAFLVDFGSTSSWVDLAAFSPPAQLSCTGPTCTYANFDFFGPWGQVSLNTADFSAFMGPPRQAGIIGTDFLSVRSMAVDYVGQRLLSSPLSQFCNVAQLEDAGFVAMPSSGFYSSNFSNLAPLNTIVLDAGTADRVPNVPTLRVRLDGVTALAQLDTGFDDAVVRHSININSAFLNDVLLHAPAALVRAQNLDLTLTTCVNMPEPVTAWRLAAGHPLEFLTVDGGGARRARRGALREEHARGGARVRRHRHVGRQRRAGRTVVLLRRWRGGVRPRPLAGVDAEALSA